MPVTDFVRPAAGIAAISLLALAAGCTTASQSARVSTYGAAYADASHYTGPDRIYRNGYVDDLMPDSSSHANRVTEARVLAAYEGIDGARLAHRLFGEAQAEKLDGACEQYVKIDRRETLYDIAQYCDVSLPLLISHNPGIRNARHVKSGQIIEVPQVFNAERHALEAAAAGASGLHYASFYVVQPGDTLSNIAAKHLVSSADVATLNPGVSWQYLPVGAQLRIPAAGGSGLSYDPPVVAPVSGALPYAYGPLSAYQPYSAGAYYAPSSNITALMPYMMTPAQQAAERRGRRQRLLTVDRVSAGPYDSVTVTGERLPANSDVSLYRGPNGSQLEYVGTVRTDETGAFAEEIPVKASSNAGGVIFRAQVDDTGEQLDSPRVGVDNIVTPEE